MWGGSDQWPFWIPAHPAALPWEGRWSSLWGEGGEVIFGKEQFPRGLGLVLPHWDVEIENQRVALAVSCFDVPSATIPPLLAGIQSPLPSHSRGCSMPCQPIPCRMELGGVSAFALNGLEAFPMFCHFHGQSFGAKAVFQVLCGVGQQEPFPGILCGISGSSELDMANSSWSCHQNSRIPSSSCGNVGISPRSVTWEG